MNDTVLTFSRAVFNHVKTPFFAVLTVFVILTALTVYFVIKETRPDR